MKNKDKVAGKAWVGTYRTGQIGWCLPFSISSGRGEVLGGDQIRCATNYRSDEGRIFYRCRITVERLRDSRGRYITRKVSDE